MARIDGTRGDDLLYSYNQADTVYGLGGSDIMGDKSFAGRPSSDTFYGGSGDDFIFTRTGNDALYGGGGRDTLEVLGLYSVTVDGGKGLDTLFISGHQHDFTVTTIENETTYQRHDHTKYDYTITVTNVEEVHFTWP